MTHDHEEATLVAAWQPVGQCAAYAEEVLAWHYLPAMPDADFTVLLWVRYGHTSDWCAGWWDGETWRDAASGGEVSGAVVAWAEPMGPNAELTGRQRLHGAATNGQE